MEGLDHSSIYNEEINIQLEKPPSNAQYLSQQTSETPSKKDTLSHYQDEMSYDQHSIRQNELLTHTLNNKEFMKATFEKSKQMNFTSTEGNLKSSLGSVKLEAHMDVNVSQSKKSNHPYQLNHTQTSRNEMHQIGNEMQIEDQEISCL